MTRLSIRVGHDPRFPSPNHIWRVAVSEIAQLKAKIALMKWDQLYKYIDKRLTGKAQRTLMKEIRMLLVELSKELCQ